MAAVFIDPSLMPRPHPLMTNWPICSLVPRPHPRLSCTTQVTWLMAFCWLVTTKKLLNGHQTPFLVSMRGWGLGTRLHWSVFTGCRCRVWNLSDVLWVGIPFMMSSTTTRAWLSDSMAAVFIDPLTSSRCRVLNLTVSCGRAHVADIVQYCLTPRTYFLIAVVIKEVVSWLWEEPVVA